MKKSIVLLFILGLFGTLAGCASTRLQPDYVPLERHDMLEIRSNAPVAVINVQQPGMTLIKVGKAEMEADLYLWAAQAVTSIGGWLQTYQVHISPEAVVKLKVSVVDAGISLKKHLPCARMSLKIETDSGITKLYPVEGCAATNNRAIGYAVLYSVIDMIRDREITDYIDTRYTRTKENE